MKSSFPPGLLAPSWSSTVSPRPAAHGRVGGDESTTSGAPSASCGAGLSASAGGAALAVSATALHGGDRTVSLGGTGLPLWVDEGVLPLEIWMNRFTP